MWSEAIESRDADYILTVVRVAQDDAAHDLDLGLRWMRGILLLRDVGGVSDDGACHLLVLVLDSLMFQYTDRDRELRSLVDELHRIERAHGLGEDEGFDMETAPADWLEVNARWDRRFDAIRADVLRSLGETELARTLVLFPDELDERTAIGRAELIGEA